MQHFIEATAAGIASGFGFTLLFLAPIVAVGFWLRRDRKRERESSTEPFTDLPRRPPGESLRLKIDELSENFDDHLVVLALTGAICAGMMLGTPASQRWNIGPPLAAGFLVVCLITAPKMRRLARQLREHRLGFKGERVVGEELNRMLGDGFSVYHDLPFERYNIDHVIVGPCGVFAVETKTRSKRSDAKWEKKATAKFDGQRIAFGKQVETDAVKQAWLNAKDLTNWLSSATGERVTVEPIITSPGWFIPDALPINGIAMWNPSRIRAFLLARPQNVLSPAQLKRICHQLDQRCAWTEPKS